MKRGFTLIELLVVIAIIAILAAILFPVFAQAKLAAKKTVALSSVQEIGLAMNMYGNDYDDETPIVFTVNNQSVDVYQLMQPYIKNMDIFFSPVWNQTNTTSCDNSADNTPPGYFVPPTNESYECVGYGYNWGFGIWAGGALLGAQETLPNNGSVTPGISMTSVDDPAQLAAFGDTYDTRRYTMCAIGSDLGQYTGAQHRSDLRFGGSFNFAFLDSHAKAIPINAYTYNPYAVPAGTGYIMMPADSSIWTNFWCSEAGVTVEPSELGLPVPNMPCSQFIQLAMSGGLGIPINQWPN